MISSNLKKMLLASVITAGSSSLANAAALLNFEIEGSTNGGASYSQTVTVTAGETVNYEIVGFLSPVTTANTNTNGAHTINALVNNKDGFTSAEFNISATDTADIPLTFSSATLSSSYTTNTSLSSSGSVNGSSVTGIYPAALGIQSTVPTTASPSLVLTGQFVVGNTITASAQTSIGGIWDFGAGGVGAFKINSPAQSVGANDTTENTNSTDPYIDYLPLTLDAAPTPEPASLGLLGLGGLALMRRRRTLRSGVATV